MFGMGDLFMKLNIYGAKDRNEVWRIATPTSIMMFDSYDMKSLWFEFGHDIFTGFKIASL